MSFNWIISKYINNISALDRRMDFSLPSTGRPVCVVPLKRSTHRTPTAAVAGLAEGFLFLSADVSQTVWLYKGLL